LAVPRRGIAADHQRPTATGTNDPEQGILIKEENSLTISSGKTVWYRNFGPAGTACLIAREAV
jgi:hypothetical protein